MSAKKTSGLATGADEFEMPEFPSLEQKMAFHVLVSTINELYIENEQWDGQEASFILETNLDDESFKTVCEAADTVYRFKNGIRVKHLYIGGQQWFVGIWKSENADESGEKEQAFAA